MYKITFALLVCILLSMTGKAQEEVKPSKINGNNVIALSPLQLTERGVGIGLSYERMIDSRGIVSLYLPFVYTFNDERSWNGYPHSKYSVQFMPGVKIYPAGSNGIVKYSVGPHIYVAYGEESYTEFLNYYSQVPTTPVTVNNDHLTLGMLVMNTLNINPTPRLFLGLELGLGVAYINKVNGNGQGNEALAQFGFKVGYRF